eukprot:scaffold3800_cov150-Alexandrium_tamarense.AAC.1
MFFVADKVRWGGCCNWVLRGSSALLLAVACGVSVGVFGMVMLMEETRTVLVCPLGKFRIGGGFLALVFGQSMFSEV